MRLLNNRILLSASDLNTFLGCRHASALDFRRSVLGEALEQATEDPGQALVRRRGDEHEQRQFETLRAATDGEVVWLRDRDLELALRLTEEAMRRGAHLIFQGVLADGGAGTVTPISWSAPSTLGPRAVVLRGARHQAGARASRPSSPFSSPSTPTSGPDSKARRHPRCAWCWATGRCEAAGARLHPLRPPCHAALGERRRCSGANGAGRVAAAGEPCAACSECRWRERCADEWEAGDHLTGSPTFAPRRSRGCARPGWASLARPWPTSSGRRIRWPGSTRRCWSGCGPKPRFRTRSAAIPRRAGYVLLEPGARPRARPAAGARSRRPVLRHGRRPALPGRRPRVPVRRRRRRGVSGLLGAQRRRGKIDIRSVHGRRRWRSWPRTRPPGSITTITTSRRR